MTPTERFWSRVDKSDGCWNWAGKKNLDGYGEFVINKKVNRTHRYSWQLHVGPVPPGMCVCHACDNPSCVNPEHLFIGTHKQSMEDKARKGRVSFGERKRGSETSIAKMNEELVTALRYVFALADPTIVTMSRETGISENAIRCAIKRKTWTHI